MKEEKLQLSSDHPALVIFDNSKAQTTFSILKLYSHELDIVLLMAYNLWIYLLINLQKIFYICSFSPGMPRSYMHNYKSNLLR